MRTSPSFESDHSFEEFDSSTLDSVERTDLETEDVLDMDWGVVSTTSSVAHGQRSVGTSDREYIGNGILILDGLDSGSSHHENHSSDLSVPGTDSLPSDIGSLSAENHEEVKVTEKAWVVSKRVVFLVGLAAFVSFSVLSGLFVRQHLVYRSTMQELGEKIQQLEKEREEIPQPPWAEENDISESSFFTLLDNCWIKAKMNVKFGDCSQNSYGLCGAFFENATQSISQWFDETFPPSHGEDISEGNLDEESPSFNDAMETLTKLPSIMGEALVSASKAVSERLASLNLGAEDDDDATDDLVRASEAFSDALNSARGAMASELHELGEDPVKYLAGAVNEASQPTQHAKVSLEGLRSVAKAVSSASIGWSEALIQTGETISIKVVEWMDDPLSYFEFKEKVSSEEEL